MDGNETNRLVKGALLLTIAGLFSKVLSAGYRIPLQNMTGDIGFYIYQQVYPILGVALVLALYGFPSAISKMMVDLKAEGKNLSFTSFYIPIFIILLGINGALFLFLFFNAPSIAGWVGDANLANTYRFAAFAFLLTPFSALLRGVFQGNYQMKPTAYSQIGEQFIRVFIIITAAVVVAVQGRDFYEVGQAAALASILGGATAILILALFFIKEKPVVRDTSKVPWNYYIRTILTLGMVAALNHMVLLVIQFADTFTLIPSLMDYGFTQMEAMEAKGVFDRGQPLIQLGTVLGSSFALALVPSISKQKLERDPDTFHHYISGAMLFSFYLAVGATVGLIAIFPEANVLLFQNDKGTVDLQILVIAILLCSLAITASAILQGLGYMKRTAGFILIAFFIKWICNQLLVPWFGITGSAVATVISLLVLCMVVLFELKRKLPGLHFFGQINGVALIKATLAMVIYILVVESIFSNVGVSTRIGLLFYIVFVAVSGGVIFIYSLLKWRAFTARELAMLPFTHVFIRIHKGRNINE
ncbi:PST family polysaccharide transporter [Virgibacillus natechei]|uniref:PST family polysaccharide transporter n=1 Tax=Virgibacillus natechei TaxID=1216297 RepID=A0ABS4IIG1_9BACI|nr:polysaccharide biosynthesis protein [Virgibacillus natechei]MBP1970370.1 PST family polysaccharide transporter [Virgibacillus natechei]UZD13194.1 polysaccharide biosynthesis protein [Virgibacillus natechei]